MSKILLFDVDGTLCESGKKISQKMKTILQKLSDKNFLIGIIGGGRYEKIIEQLDNFQPTYIFSECGSVYHKYNNTTLNYELIFSNDIRSHPYYKKMNELIKHCLRFISHRDYIVSGNFIDIRKGLIYVSLVGMQATDKEREDYINADKMSNYRQRLMKELGYKLVELKMEQHVSVVTGGEVGIAIYPKIWNKTQVLNYFTKDDNISYFGDKFEEDGNDYLLINHPDVIGHPILNPDHTYTILDDIYKKLT